MGSSLTPLVLATLSVTVAGARESQSCSGPPFDLPARFVGTWQEYEITDDGEVPAGILESGYAAGGCVFTQRFESVDGSFSFMSLARVDPATNTWLEFFVLSDGRSATYRWRQEDGDVLFVRIDGDPARGYRLRATNFVGDSAFDVIEESSEDGGKTWAPGVVTPTRRVTPTAE